MIIMNKKKKNAAEIRDIGNLEITVNLPMRNDESQEDIQEQLLQQMRRFTVYCEAIGDSLRGGGTGTARASSHRTSTYFFKTEDPHNEDE